MNFNLSHTIDILNRTPDVLSPILSGLPIDWLKNNEGADTWSPYGVLGHLIHGEKTDWIPRAQIILSAAADKTFIPFDRFAHQKEDQQRPIEELLAEFKALRVQNLNILKAMEINEGHLALTGQHPELGVVSLRQLLSTWTAHDLGHIAQITRVMAKQYREQVGPWSAYLGILKQ